jgi:hypothetical protein
MRGVHEEIFEGLVYQQGASIRSERVKTSNSCVRILIFGSFLLLPFVKKKFPPLFRFFDLAFYYIFSFFDLVFYRPLFSPSFLLLFVPVFFAHVVSSLAYPNLLENKRLGCCC